jgi:hypothetical protein
MFSETLCNLYKLPQVIKIGSIVTTSENNIALVFEIGFE